MCYSAEASFTMSALLLPAGVFCAARAIRRNLSYLPLALLPAIFGVQQISEGCVWLGLAGDVAGLVRVASLVFLFFAIPFWLFWIPFSLFFIEPRKNRQVFFGVTMLCGLVGGLVAYLPALVYPDVFHTRVLNHSIQYNIATAQVFQIVPYSVWQALYLTIVAAPLLGTSLSKNFIGFGIVLVLSAGVCYFFYWYAFASVWCFCAAVLSGFMCFFFGNLPAPPSIQCGADRLEGPIPSSVPVAEVGV